MKNYTFLITLFALMIVAVPRMSTAQEPQDVVHAYFQAMKEGDIETMKAHMGGKLYEKRKILLEQNRNYPDFLKHHYEDGQIHVGEFNEGGVKVTVEFPDGSIHYHHVIVAKNSSGQWILLEEIPQDR